MTARAAKRQSVTADKPRVSFAAVVAVLCAAAVGLAVALTQYVALTLVLALLSIAALSAIDDRYLPALAIVIFSLIPVAYMNVPDPFGHYVTPTVGVIALWSWRRVSDARTLPVSPLSLLLVVLLVLVLCLESLASIDKARSIAWSFALIFGLLFPAVLAGSGPPERGVLLLRTWAWIGAALAMFGLIEAIAKTNPLAELYYAPVDLSAFAGPVNYRIRTLLGHALMNSTYFATTAVLLLGAAVRCPNRLYWTSGLLCLGAVAVTGSRGAAIAVSVGLLVTFWDFIRRRGVSFGWKSLGLITGVLGLASVILSPTLRARNEAIEGIRSAQIRDLLPDVALEVTARGGWLLGSGPGTSETALSLKGYDLPLENSLLQVLVSLGVLGSLTLVVAIGYFLMKAAQRGDWHIVSAGITYSVAVAGFNAWDTNPGIFALLGLITLCSIPVAALQDVRSNDQSTVVRSQAQAP